MNRTLNKNKVYISYFREILESRELKNRERKINRKAFQLNKDGRKKESNIPRYVQQMFDKIFK